MSRLTNIIIDNRLIGTNIERLGNFVNSKTLLLVKCLKDGNIWSARPDGLFKGIGCPLCFKNSKRLTETVVSDRLKKVNITLLEPYTDCRDKILVKCTNCGDTWKSTIRKNLEGSGCIKCAIRRRSFTNADIDESIKLRNIIRLDDYKGADTKIRWQCGTCNNIWLTTPYVIVNIGCSCPLCKKKGEKKVHDILKSKFSNIEQQYYVNINNKKYYCDFYIEQINTIIEYNGRQHYGLVCFGGITKEEANNNYKKQIIRDEIIKNYCIQNNINLITIKHTESDDSIHKIIGGL